MENKQTSEEDLKTSIDKMAMDESPKSPTILPWDRFSNWLHCVCVVTFDLELGQAMEVNEKLSIFFLRLVLLIPTCLTKLLFNNVDV